MLAMPLNQSGSKLNSDIDFTLRRVFGKTSFRPYQREIIKAALEGHDVFVQAGQTNLEIHEGTIVLNLHSNLIRVHALP